MFTDFTLHPTETDPRTILVVNSSAIVERLDAGMKIVSIHRELSSFLKKKSDTLNCSHSTFKRYLKTLSYPPKNKPSKSGIVLRNIMEKRDSKKSALSLETASPPQENKGLGFSTRAYTEEEIFGDGKSAPSSEIDTDPPKNSSYQKIDISELI